MSYRISSVPLGLLCHLPFNQNYFLMKSNTPPPAHFSIQRKAELNKIQFQILCFVFFGAAFLSPVIWKEAGGEVFGQSGQKWATDLNPASGTDALGTSNLFPLIIKTNSIERLRVKETGEILLYNVMGYDADYSSLFTSRSLVDKAYMDQAIANAIAGLPPPVVPTLTNVLMAGRNADPIGIVNDNFGNLSLNINQRKLFNALGIVKLDWEQGYLYNTGGNTTLNWHNRTLNAGIWNYDADYSADYTPRSLVDMEYVDTRVKNAITPSYWSAGTGTAAVMNDQGGGNNAGGNYSLIGAGQNNLIEPNAPFGVILGGTGNTIFNAAGPSNNHDYNLIGVGQGNTIQSTASHAIVLGGTNNSAAGLHSTVIGGIGNTGSGSHSFIGAGTNNSVATNAPYGAILSGAGNSIQNFLANTSSFNFISSGQSNTIQHDANYSSIIGGSNNTIQSGANNSVILGGSNITATQSNTVYMANIAVPGFSGTGDRLLVADANGNLKVQPNQFLGGPWEKGGNDISGTPGAFIGTTTADDLVFKSNNEERMRITSSGDHPGNVGIGTGAPDKKLHVVTTHTLCVNCPQTHAGIRLEDQVTDPQLNSTTANAWDLQPVGATDFAILKANGVPKMFFTGSGLVGIGTVTPTEKLEVAGNIKVSGLISTAGKIQASAFASTSPLIFEAPIGTERARIDDVTGNFGINNNNPLFTLDVNGIINATQLLINGNIGIGITNPLARLHIAGPGNQGIDISSTDLAFNSYIRLMAVTSNNRNESQLQYVGRFSFVEPISGVATLTIDENGTINCKKLRVATTWSDFVFDENYQRMNYIEKELFYKKYKHLPNVPPAAEIEADGLDLGNVMKGIMQNVEEDRLDITELFSKMSKVAEQNELLLEQIEELKRQIQILMIEK